MNEATQVGKINEEESWEATIERANRLIANPNINLEEDHQSLAAEFGVTTDYLDSIGLSKNSLASGMVVHETDLLGDDKIFKTPIAGKPRYFIKAPDITTRMSNISLGLDVIEGKRIIAKELSYDDRSPDALDGLRREVLLQAGLDPKHTVRILDLVTHTSSPIIIMEREEHTLYDLITRKRNLFTEDIISITGGIISNLRYLRSVGVVHRDVKSANIYINEGEQRTRLGDFGIAQGVRELGPDHVTGTPSYMSPERLLGKANLENSQELEKDEIYTLGLMVYEMISGETYFTGGRRDKIRNKDEAHKAMSEAEIIHELMMENYFRLVDDPRLVKIYGEDFLKLTDKVLSKALNYYKEGRQRTLEEFFEDLSGAALGELPQRYLLPEIAEEYIHASSKRRYSP